MKTATYTLDQASWDAGCGPISAEVLAGLGWEMLPANKTGCESHHSRLAVYADDDGQLWLASYDEPSKTISVEPVTALQVMQWTHGDDWAEVTARETLGL